MKNLIPIEDFLNEQEDPNAPNISALDILSGENCRDVFAWYLATLPNLDDREKAISGDIIGQIDDLDFEDNWQDDPDDLDPAMLDNLIGNIGDQVHDGAYHEEEVGDGWFNEDQYSDFLDMYVHVYEHGDIEENGPISIYNLDPLQLIKFATEKNPPFIEKFLGDNCLDAIKTSVDKGVPLDYKTILKNAEKWKPGSTTSILATIDQERIKKLNKAYTLLKRK